MKFFEAFDNFLFSLSKISICLIVLLTSLDAGGRHLFNNPIIGAYEFTDSYLMIIMTFFSISYVWKLKGHVGITFLYDKFSQVGKNLSFILIHLLGILVFSAIAHAGWQMTWDAWVNNYFEKGVVEWPVYLSYIGIPIGGYTMALHMLLELVISTKRMITSRSLNVEL